MSAIGNSRTQSGNSIIQTKFMERILQQEAQNIIQEQNRVISRFKTSQEDLIKSKRKFTVSGGNLEFTHAMAQRFIDMKRIRGKKKVSIPIHNTILYSHFNNIINRVAVELTEDFKQLIAQEHNINL